MIDIFSDRIYLHGNENHKSGIPCTFPRTVPMQINRSFGFTTTSCSNTFNAFSFSLHFPDIIISNNKLHLLRKFLFHFDLLFFGQCDHIPVPKTGSYLSVWSCRQNSMPSIIFSLRTRNSKYSALFYKSHQSLLPYLSYTEKKSILPAAFSNTLLRSPYEQVFPAARQLPVLFKSIYLILCDRSFTCDGNLSVSYILFIKVIRIYFKRDHQRNKISGFG